MIRNLWPLLIGFTIWAAGFLVVYSLQALGCVWSWPQPGHRTVLITTVAVTLLVLGAALTRQRAVLKSHPSAIGTAGVALTLVAMVAALFTFSPVVFVSICD